MNQLFVWIGETSPFQLFKTQHFAALFVLIFLNVLMVIFAGNIRKHPGFDRSLRYVLGASMIIQEVFLSIWRIQQGIWHVSDSLPLHMCGISLIMGSALFYTKKQWLFDITYYWSIGAVMALLTPDITTTGFPSFRYYQFFLSHGLIVTQSVYFIVVLGFKPSKMSLKRTLVFSNIILVLVFIFNHFTGGNYFFVAHKPEAATFIDLLGPWPFYILSLEAVAAFLFTCMYLPFRKHNKTNAAIPVTK